MLDGPEFLAAITGQAGVDRLTGKPAILPDPDVLLVVVPTEHGYAMSTHPGQLAHLIQRDGASIWSGDRTSSDNQRPWM